jgi:putative FmdB family regulatory protein
MYFREGIAMPTYEFRCRSCQENFSVREKISDYDASHGEATCPKCGSHDVERLLSDFYARTARKS